MTREADSSSRGSGIGTILTVESDWRIADDVIPRVAFAASLARFPFLAHGVTLRGDESDPFNLSFSVTEDWEDLRESRMAVCERFGFAARSLVVPAQVHGAEVAVVGAEHGGAGALSPDTAIPGCDALTTNTPGLLLGITVADCLPVFCVDPVHQAVGLAHSGWRGTAGRIVPRTLERMTQAFGTSPKDCWIAIGPGIGPDGYEVDEAVHAAFDPSDAAAPGVFSPTRPGHWALDLTAAVAHQLRVCDVPARQLDLSPWRTDIAPELFFSHRRIPGCPRMGAFLGLRILD